MRAPRLRHLLQTASEPAFHSRPTAVPPSGLHQVCYHQTPRSRHYNTLRPAFRSTSPQGTALRATAAEPSPYVRNTVDWSSTLIMRTRGGSATVPLRHPSVLGRSPQQHRVANRAYRRLRSGTAHRELARSMDNGACRRNTASTAPSASIGISAPAYS